MDALKQLLARARAIHITDGLHPEIHFFWFGLYRFNDPSRNRDQSASRKNRRAQPQQKETLQVYQGIPQSKPVTVKKPRERLANPMPLSDPVSGINPCGLERFEPPRALLEFLKTLHFDSNPKNTCCRLR